MNTRPVAYLLLTVVLSVSAQVRTTVGSPEVLLERAIQKQTIDGDLKSAIEIYKNIVELHWQRYCSSRGSRW